MAHDVFISYSSQDRGKADAACAFLEREGIRCWIAPRDVRPGASWARELPLAIREARAFVLVFSASSNKSHDVAREVGLASQSKIPVIPFRIDSTTPAGELEYYIASAHWLDAMEPPLDAHLLRLRDTLRGILEAPTAIDATGSQQQPDPGHRRSPMSRVFESRRSRIVAVGALLAVGLSVAAIMWSRRSGTLAIESEPADVMVTLDGKSAGTTPLALAVASGSHGVLVRRTGFKDWSKVVEVSPGERASFSLQLVVADSRDAAAVNLLARPLGVMLQRYTLPEAQRKPPPGEPLELIVPRGAVRPADVTTLLMDADPERVEPSGVIALRQGRHTLMEAPFEPRPGQFELAVPQAIRERIRLDEALIWGWWPKSGPPVTVTLRVVADDVAPLFADIGRRLRDQSEPVRGHVRVQALLDHHLFTGAFLEARALSLSDPIDLRASAEMEQALVKLDGAELRLVTRLRDVMLRAPVTDRAAVFGAPGTSMDR